MYRSHAIQSCSSRTARLRAASVALVAFSVAVGSTADAALIDNLVAYYNYETNLHNQVGAGDLTVTGGGDIAGWSGGTVSRGDGTSDRSALLVGNAGNYVDVDNDRTRAPFANGNLGDSFTISAWYYLAPNSANASTRYFVFEGSNNFDVSYGISSGDTYVSYVGQTAINSTVTARNGWHHVLHSFDSDGTTTTLSAYIDGTLVATGSAATSAVDFAALNIGLARDSAGDRDWDGLIDEVAIWDRALSPTEAAAVRSLGLNGLAVTHTPEPERAFVFDGDGAEPGDSTAGVSFSGWAPDTFTPVAGSDNDLGDGGFEGAYFRTQTSGPNTLTIQLTDLPGHAAVNLSMIVAQLDSLDPGRDGDRFIVRLDGQEILSVGLGYGDSVNGSFSDELVMDVRINGVSVDPSVIASLLTIGGVNAFGDANFLENMYDLGLLDAFQLIPHGGDTLTLEIIGLQNQTGGEFYGVDNIRITLVPEPASLTVLAGGLALLARRRRRSRG